MYGDKPLPKHLRAWVKNELPEFARVLKKPMAGVLFALAIQALTTGEVCALEQAGEEEWRRRVQALSPWTTICTIQDSGSHVSEEKVWRVVRIVDGGGGALAREIKGHNIAQVKEKLLSLQVRSGAALRRVRFPSVTHAHCGQHERHTMNAGVGHHVLVATFFPPHVDIDPLRTGLAKDVTFWCTTRMLHYCLL